MIHDTFYCSELSRQVNEKAYGTASTGRIWLLLEHRSPWGPKPLEDSNLPPLLKRQLARSIRAVPRSRLLFIRQERTSLRPLKFIIVFSRELDPFTLQFEFEDPSELLSLDIPALMAGCPTDALISRDPLFLVCTHGRRDKCCAKYGFALYKFLKGIAGDSLWQSSHVGGDRFAANLVSFPHGLFHAHVSNESGTRILRNYMNGVMTLKGYRGRACYGRTAQAAELFVRAESGIAGIESLSFLSQKRAGENCWIVNFEDLELPQVHTVQVSTHPSQFQNLMSCHAIGEQRVAQYALDKYAVTTRIDGQRG